VPIQQQYSGVTTKNRSFINGSGKSLPFERILFPVRDFDPARILKKMMDADPKFSNYGHYVFLAGLPQEFMDMRYPWQELCTHESVANEEPERSL